MDKCASVEADERDAVCVQTVLPRWRAVAQRISHRLLPQQSNDCQHTAFVPFWFVYGISIMDMRSAHTRTVYHARRDSHVFTLLSGSWMCVGVCVYDMSLTHKAYTKFPRSRELRVRSGLRRARDRQRGEGRGASRAVRFAYLLSVSPFLSFFPVADGLRSAHISRSS